MLSILKLRPKIYFTNYKYFLQISIHHNKTEALNNGICDRSRSFSTSGCANQIRNEETALYIFDRNTKVLQRERAASAKDVNVYDYIKDEVGYRLADRIFDIKRKFKRAADIGILAS